MSEPLDLRDFSRPDPAPDYAHGYLRVPLAVWSSVYCRSPFTRRQLQLLSVVIRESWGWRAPGGGVYLWTRRLTPRQFHDITGLSTDRLGWELRTLVHRGVLREQEGRYQFVPQSHLWRLPSGDAVPPALAPAELRRHPAETASATPGLKKAKKRERNVAAPADELSPTGDNPALVPVATTPAPSTHVRSVSEAEAAAALVSLVQALASPLPGGDLALLRRWFARAGAAAVWQALAPLVASGPQDLAARLSARLAHAEREPIWPEPERCRSERDPD